MTTAKRLYEEALTLPDEEREDLALRLLQSVATGEDEPIRLHPEWEAEIARRLERSRSGQSRPVSAEEGIERIRAWR